MPATDNHSTPQLLQPIKHLVEGLPSSGDENAMEDTNLQLGLQSSNHKILKNEHQHNVHESSQDSLESRASCTNATMTTINPLMYQATDLLMAVSISADFNKEKIFNHAMSSMKELQKMAQEGEPLWNRTLGGACPSETLNEFEYIKNFGSIDSKLIEIMRMVEVGDVNGDLINGELVFQRGHLHELEDQCFRSESSRYVSSVKAHAVEIVDLIMDVNKWAHGFSNLVSNVTLIGIVCIGQENVYDGALLVLKAEFHLPTALVPARKTYFARFSKQLSENAWGVVDFSLEELLNHPLSNYQRRPSGCYIYGTDRNLSEVTWVEHGRVKGVEENIYGAFVASGYGFGAMRWVTSLVRYYEWLITFRTQTTPTADGVLIPQGGRESLLKLGERMRRIYWGDVNTSTGNNWVQMPISLLNLGAEDIRVMIKPETKWLGTGNSPGTLMFFTLSFSLPLPHRTVFNFLTQDSSRHKWDLRLRSKNVEELAYIQHGDDVPENKLSILQITRAKKVEMTYLQENYTDESGSYMIYTPIDLTTMSELLNGGNPDRVMILPSGFAILPDMPVFGGVKKPVVCGSLVTLSFCMFDEATVGTSVPLGSFQTMHRLLYETAVSIRNAFRT